MADRSLARVAALAVVLIASACAGARPKPPAAPTTRAFVVPGHGRLVLTLPPGWRVKEEGETREGVPAIRLERPGARLLVLLTPVWNPGEPESPDARAGTAQLLAELGRRKALAGSVEGDIPLEELAGGPNRGAWFAATDRDLVGRDAGPDEFHHVLQGAAAVGPVILAFTLLDDEAGPWRSEVLDLVRTARHVPDGADAAEEGLRLEPLEGIATVPLRVALPGRSWALLVDLPGFAVARVAQDGRPPPDAAHVLARSEEGDLVVSVLLVPAGAAADAAGCRAQALARIRANVSGLEDLREADGGGTAAATYAVGAASGGAREWHAHAFLFREGVCATVHVSKADPGPDDAGRMDAVLSTVRLAEDL